MKRKRINELTVTDMINRCLYREGHCEEEGCCEGMEGPCDLKKFCETLSSGGNFIKLLEKHSDYLRTTTEVG